MIFSKKIQKTKIYFFFLKIGVPDPVVRAVGLFSSYQALKIVPPDMTAQILVVFEI